MATAIRGHLLGASLLLGVLGFWASHVAAVSEGATQERLQQDLEDLENGSLPPDAVPALAQWVFRDATASKEQRVRVLSGAVDAKLRHRIRLPAQAEEDPAALLALVLSPGLRAQLQADCPQVPSELSVICDSAGWSLLEQSVGKALMEIMNEPQAFAAASRVGGNDLSLQAADALCWMGEQGEALARKQVREAHSERGRALGVMGVGCAGQRELTDELLQEWMRHPSSPGIRLAARLECAVREDCVLAESSESKSSVAEALGAYAAQIQRGLP